MDLILINTSIARRNRDNTFTGTNTFDRIPIYLNAHGTFYSTVTQTIANIANTQVITLERDSDKNLLTHDIITNNSRIYVDQDGSYEVFFSGIANLTSSTNKHLNVWLRMDGTDVAYSNTIVELTGAIEQTVAVSFIIDVLSGHYIELATWGDSTVCQWLATPAGINPTRPVSPSVVITVKMVSSIP